MPTALTPPSPGTIAGYVGPGAFARGAAYRDQGRVTSVRWDARELRLDGSVRGSLPTYRATVWFARVGQRLEIDDSSCTCPVRSDCKHVAALLLEAYHTGHDDGLADMSPTAAPPQASAPAWRRTLDRLPATAPVTTPEQARVTPLALQFRLDGGPGSGVSVRPVKQGVKGGWSGGYEVSWDVLQHQYYGERWEPVAREWLLELAAMRRPTSSRYGSSTWENLSGFTPRVLWPHLARAADLGVPLVGAGKGRLHVAEGAEAVLDLTARDGGLHLTPAMSFDGLPTAAAMRGSIGDGGLFAVEDDVLVLGPTPAPLTLAAIELLRAAPVVVPADDVADFWSSYHPRLSRQITLTSSDASVRLPTPALPTLVVTAEFEGPPLLRIGCAWEYATPSGPVTYAWQPTMQDAASRDLAAEQRVRDAVAQTIRGLPALRDTTLGDHLTLADLDALDAAEVLLPALAEVDDVRVDVERQPEYQQLTGAPAVTVATVDTERTDWFDLAVTVRVADHDVPLRSIIEALGSAKKRLMLVDGSWLRLDHPALDRLRDLLDEASRLADRPGRPYATSISRYHAALWEDLDELADVVDVSEGWRAAVGGLLALTSDDAAARPQPLPPPSGLKAELRPYQQQGFEWLAFLHEHGLGGILADDMGLGKTLQTLALIEHARAVALPPCAEPPSPPGAESPSSSCAESQDPAPHPGSCDSPRSRRMTGADTAGPDAVGPGAAAGPGAPPFLVVAPASVVSNWAAEAARFTPGLRVVTRTTTSTRTAAPLAQEVAGADVVVTSYAIFRLDSDSFHDLPWAGLILDEAQFIKNHASRVNACARALPAPFKLAITGTPMENDVGELWALLTVVAPGLYPSRRRFADDFVKPLTAAARPGAAPDVRRFAVSRAALLRRRVRPLMLRRTKEQVAPELPERQEQVLTVDLAPAHRRAYDTRLQRERTRVLGMLDDVDGNRMAIFKSLTTLRRMALDATLVDAEAYAGVPSSKLDMLVDQLAEVVAEGHRALVFSQFTGYLALVRARLDSLGLRHAYLDGTTRRRADVIRGFKDGDAPLFLISLKAGGFGLNLTEADHVYLLDPWWNPATEAQAVDRTHRIGQVRPVNVVRLVAAGTIEEKVMELKERKAAAVGAVLGDGDDVFSRALDADDLRTLFTPDR